MAGGREYNQGRLKELVLLFATRSAEDEGFGMVKLNKLLCRADFEAFRLLGSSITGEVYERQEFGPVARHLYFALDELASRHYIVWTFPTRGDFTAKVPVAHEGPDEAMFSSAELAIINATVTELAPHGARSVSAWSHEQFVGWQMMEDGDEIPYSSAVLSLRPLSDEKRRAIHGLLVERYGPSYAA
jgi:Antitoxin SocA-like, Panacea domain